MTGTADAGRRAGGWVPAGKDRDAGHVKVVLMTRYSPLGASSRYRTYQYLPYFKEKGLDVFAAPFFDDEYLRRLYSGAKPRPTMPMLAAYARRLSTLLTTTRFDVLFFEKELLPMVPYTLERRFMRAPALVIDLDDALFHNYDMASSRIVRLALRDKIDRAMAHAALTVAGNPYIARRAAAAGCPWVEIVPSVVDLHRYDATLAGLAPPRPQTARFTVGWIGTPVTAEHLSVLEPALARLSAEGPVRLMVIGARSVNVRGVEVECRPWSEQTEVADLAECDVGVMPLADSPFERGKCGLKLVQYMACRKPVVASPVGVNRQLVEPGANGFLATSCEQWLEAFRALRDDPQLRRTMGDAGRRKVEQQYSLTVTGPRLAELVCEAAKRSVCMERAAPKDGPHLRLPLTGRATDSEPKVRCRR